MKNMKKMFVMVLALVLCFSLAVPAMAADAGKFDITIKQDASQQQDEHIYEAYQVFSGTITKNESGQDVLSTIEWGSGVNGAGLLAALLADNTYKSYFKSDMTAEQVADAIAKAYSEKGSAFSFALRHMIAENLTGTHAVSVEPANGVYTIPNVAPGYYFIKDKDESLKETYDSYTNYILEVVGDTNVTPKGGTVYDEKVMMNGSMTSEASDHSIGDVITFVLNGTLPANYGTFTTFEYSFVDTMSEGLTFNSGSVEVYIENDGKDTLLTEGYVLNWDNPEVEGDGPSVKGATFTVDFADLKKISSVYIDASTEIEVHYTATLNANAEIGAPGNLNKSHVEFSNDPHSKEKGKTPDNYTFVFTWELDNTKVNGQDGKPLANAEFVLYKGSGENKKYVTLDGDNKVTGWTTDKTKATTMKSTENGLFAVIGLDSGTYYLEETKAPEGYHLLDEPVKVIISAGVSMNGEDEATVEYLNIKVGDASAADGNKETGVVNASIANNPGAHLPETGGVGTTMFYIGGTVMVAAAAILLIAKKRKVEE